MLSFCLLCAAAQSNYGASLQSGDGVAADSQLAATWYRASAEQGDYLGEARVRRRKSNELQTMSRNTGSSSLSFV